MQGERKYLLKMWSMVATPETPPAAPVWAHAGDVLEPGRTGDNGERQMPQPQPAPFKGVGEHTIPRHRANKGRLPVLCRDTKSRAAGSMHALNNQTGKVHGAGTGPPESRTGAVDVESTSAAARGLAHSPDLGTTPPGAPCPDGENAIGEG